MWERDGGRRLGRGRFPLVVLASLATLAGAGCGTTANTATGVAEVATSNTADEEGAGTDTTGDPGQADLDDSQEPGAGGEPEATGEGEADTGDNSSGGSRGGAEGRPPPATLPATMPASWADIDFYHGFTYDLDDFGRSVTVTDGEASEGEPGDVDYLYATVDQVIVGDADGDGTDEAAVILYFTTGGTGQFTDLFLYRLVDDEPVLVDRAGTGDRGHGGIIAAWFDGDDLVMDRYGGEAACCPDRQVTTWHRLEGDRLVTVGGPIESVLVFVSTSDPAPPEIKFLRGTTSAAVMGDGDGADVAVLEAGRGQTLTLTLYELDDAGLAEGVEVIDQTTGEAILDVGRGSTGEVRLPNDGFYALRPHSARGLFYFELFIDIR